MKQEILAAANGSALTRSQGSALYKLTGLKFWEPETLPVPTVGQGSILIGGLIAYRNKQSSFEHKDYKTQQVTILSNADILECIQLWFPAIESMKEVKPRFFKKKEEDHHEEEPAPTPEPESKPSGSGGKKHKEPMPTPEQPPMPEPKKQEKPKQKEPESPEESGQSNILQLIKAGIKNIWMVGPAGCGKTTLCQLAGDELEIPVTVIPCGAGTSATTFLGYKYPEREGTPFVHAFSQPGIIVLDEFTALEAQVAQIANSALANNELSSTIGTQKRHPDCIIIATSNTFGTGGDRQYVANNQLDASTIDRFACGFINVDYSHEYESRYDSEVVSFVNKMRTAIDRNGLRKIASTRSVINGCLLKEAGLNWKDSLTTNWSKDEKALLR